MIANRSVLFAWVSAACLLAAPDAGHGAKGEDVVREVIELVEEHFVFPDKLGTAAWSEATGAALRAVMHQPDPIELERAINEMLASLETSHTSYFTPGNPKYHELLDVFSAVPAVGAHIEASYPEGRVMYETTGLVLEETPDGRWWIREILPGSLAAATPLIVGNEIATIGGRPYRGGNPFAGEAGRGAAIGGGRGCAARPHPRRADRAP